MTYKILIFAYKLSQVYYFNFKIKNWSQNMHNNYVSVFKNIFYTRYASQKVYIIFCNINFDCHIECSFFSLSEVHLCSVPIFS